ncbi:MAG: ribonuclease HII [Candidatus Buchananbacteria bacterium]
MFYPNRRNEKRLQRKGFAFVVGLDEAGRGAWAGPIVAGAVILDPKVKIKGIKDSKLLRSPDRKEVFERIVKSALAWSVGIVSHETIDEIGINQANILAMQDALKKITPQPDYLLVDAVSFDYKNLPLKAVIKGDYKITSVAAASIVAKVIRDQLMDELDEQYPQYAFKQHKGYGTNQHHQMLMKYGVSQIHRKTYQPMKYLITQ